MTLAVPVSEELASNEFFRDPYPCYARLRAQDGPFWLPHRQETSSDGIWLFSRYQDGEAVFKQTQGVTKHIRSIRPEGFRSAFDLNVLHRDGADHLRLRRLVSEYFSPLAIERHVPTMISVAKSLLGSLKHKSDFDLVAEFAEPLPLAIIASLLGVPEKDMAQVRAWSLLLADGFDSLLSHEVMHDRQKRAMADFMGYAERLIEAKQSHPDSSMLGFLVQASGSQLDHEELVAMTGFLLFAGHETTVSLIGNAVWLLLSHPQQWSLLSHQIELVPNAIEEVLRFESPEQRTSFRLVNEPIVVNGHKLEPDQQIGVIIGSLNRDDSVFERANEFDILRRTNKHLAFGVGLHNCLGKTLARIEARVALSLLLEAFPALALQEHRPDWRRNSFFRGLNTLRVRVT